jgi:hypothetical protein
MPIPDNAPSHELLDRMRYQADTQADATVSRIIGTWNDVPSTASVKESQAINALQWRRLAYVSRLFGKWQNNGSLANWKSEDPGTPAEIAAELEKYVHAAQALPEWASREKIALAEKVFIDNGFLSCVLLFCSSLPECYIAPDLSSVLHVSGQLESNTDYRIRATAAMIFPVMMKGGLTSPEGSGVAQILKVRLIHATIRNLILHGNPEEVAQAFCVDPQCRVSKVQPTLADSCTSGNMPQNLFARGWDLRDNALPCNQEELAYTLLTFGYVFLRSLRRLGLGLSRAEEEAYLHAWNVVGHVLGIQRELMADTMEQAAGLFAQIQARGRSRQVEPDPRPALAQALMQTMQSVIPARILKPFPVLLTIHLCGRANAKELGLHRRTFLLSRLLFALLALITRGIDWLIHLVFPRFSIARLSTRVLGEHFMSQVLLSQIRPLKLPQPLLNQVQTMVDVWGCKPKSKPKDKR